LDLRRSVERHDQGRNAPQREGGVLSRAQLRSAIACGRAGLPRRPRVTIAPVGDLLKARPDWLITIEGHTDNIGIPASNLTLSQRRAEAVRAALVETYQTPADHLTAIGFGQTQPVETNATIEGRARNRRVELSRKCQ
jgi:OOP family OmpA-OmpF porin